MANAVVVLPGIMGSVLKLGNEVIWPGPVQSLLFAYKKMNELLREELVAADILRSVSISEQYQSLLDDLATCGFVEDADPKKRTLWVCPYDWRKKNELAARRLADLLDEAVAALGADVELTLIGHSMGGLVSRHYLESGLFDARPGHARVRRLVTIGTPHRGAPLALAAALGMEKRVFLSAEQVHQLASDPRYPSLYQLLPPRGEPFVWNDGVESTLETLDPYDPAVAAVLGTGLVPENLQAAAAFHATLDPARRPAHVRYFAFSGSREQTITAVTARRAAGAPGFRIDKLEAPDAGDGTVPLWSASLPGIQGRPVGGVHASLFRDRDVRRTLASLLGKRGVLAGEKARVEVTLRTSVVAPGADVGITLRFPDGAAQIDGTLVIERAELGAGDSVAGFAPQGAPLPVRYAGPPTVFLGVEVQAPDVAGIYRVSWQAGAAAASGSDELFVQEP